MGAFYGSKILNGETNPKTGKVWKLEDVPSLWKPKAEKWLEDY
ncbi:hypothetical protein IMSAGC019_03138 [Lachnospiraceae bacterium]|nr:hypothetical protein IMSAGC019_03138 [Lachnospiraceae bacterium]